MLSVARNALVSQIQVLVLSSQPIHLSSSLNVIPIPQRRMPSGPIGLRIPGKRGISSRSPPPSPPGMGEHCWPVGCETGQVQWEFTLTRQIWVHPGDVHFSQEQYPPPLSYIPYPEWHEWAKGALIQQKLSSARNECRVDWGGWPRPHSRAEGGAVLRAIPVR